MGLGREISSTPRQLPLAIGIFTIFPVIGYGVLVVARSRPGTSEQTHGDHVRVDDAGGVGAAAAVRASISRRSAGIQRDHYALLFGWLFLIDAGLLAIAIARSRELLHAVGALARRCWCSALWLAISYVPGAMVPVMGFVALFVALYLAAPTIAARFGEAFEDAGEYAILVAPLLLFVFPLLVVQRAASRVAGADLPGAVCARRR